MPHCPECAATVSERAVYCSVCGAAVDAPSPAVEAPAGRDDMRVRMEEDVRTSLAPRYEMLRAIGRGGMGSVFLAREPALKRLVAVKVLSPYLAFDETAHIRFQREARAVAALAHPNVVAVYLVGETAALSLPYLVMRYVEGPSLAEWMKEHPRPGERDARRILGGVAAALAAAHERGIAHRDIKPGNILLESGSGQVLVADFGLAAALATPGTDDDTTITAAGMILGTPIYMSPEQAVGESAGAPSDVYSLGMVGYEMLAGRLPFTATSSIAWAVAHQRSVPPPMQRERPDVSPEMATLIDRALAKTPADRPQARDLAQGLIPSLDTEIPWPPVGFQPIASAGRSMVRASLVAVAAGLLFLLGLAAFPSPASADGDWWTRFAPSGEFGTSSLGVRSEQMEPSGAGVWPTIWLAGLLLALVALLGAWARLLVLSVRTWLPATQLRSFGWHRETILDAASDPDGRSGLLLTGAREFAALGAADRLQVLRARRVLWGMPVLAGVWTIAALAVWSIGVASGILPLRGMGAVASLGLCLAIAVPAVIALLVAVRARARESRLLGGLPRRRSHTDTFAVTNAGPSAADAREWYARFSAGVDHPSAGSKSLAPTIWAAHAAAVIATLAAGAALILFAAATVISARTAQRIGPETAALAAEIDAPGPGPAAARRAWERYLPPSIAVPDSLARRWISALSRAGDGPAAAAYPSDPNVLLRPPGAPRSGAGGVRGFIRGAAAGLAPDTARMLAALDGHPTTALFRRLARASVADIRASRPEPAYSAFREAAQANALGAVLAMSRSDLATAATRFGENAAVARHFLRAPDLFANRFGIGMLQELAILPLADLERMRGDSAAADQLEEAAASLRQEGFAQRWALGLAGLAADARELDRFSAALVDERFLPGNRIEGFDGALNGMCLNPRELIVGRDPARAAAVVAAAERMQSVSNGAGLARGAVQEWAGTGFSAGVPGWLRSIAKGPMAGATMRLGYCSMLRS